MELKFTVQTKILKPIEEVFGSIVNPEKLNGYFTKTASGPIKEGSTVQWTWVDYPETANVTVTKVKPNELIVLEWPAHKVNYSTRVEIALQPLDKKSTMVKITEGGWKTDQPGLDSSYAHCQGWQHMTCCMKAYLEHGINLRAGGIV